MMNIFPLDDNLLACFREAESFGELKVYVDSEKYPKSFMVWARSQHKIDAALNTANIPDLASKEIKRGKRGKIILRFRPKEMEAIP